MIFSRAFILIGSLLIASLTHADESALQIEPGQKIFKPIPEKTEQIFLTAVREGKLYDPPDETQIYPAENQLSDVWAGNKPTLSAVIKDIQLHWRASAGSVTGTSADFVMDLLFANDHMLITHSRPFFGKQAGGIRVPLDPYGKVRRFWYRGKDGTSLIVIVPRFSPKERDRGVVFCPRDFLPEGSRSDKASLRATALEIDHARYTVDGEVRGQLRNAVAMGSARAMILVSPRVVPSSPFQDEIFSKVSHVAVFYKPAQQDFPIRSADLGDVTDGIEVGIELHQPTGFKRYSRLRELVHIKRISEPVGTIRLQILDAVGTALYAEAQQRGIKLKEQVLIEAKVEDGPCYLVLNDRGTIIHDYFKEPFSLPEKFKQDGADGGEDAEVSNTVEEQEESQSIPDDSVAEDSVSKDDGSDS